MTKPNKIVKLVAASLVFLVGALLPLRNGEPISTMLLILASVFAVVALVVAFWRGRAADTPRSSA